MKNTMYIENCLEFDTISLYLYTKNNASLAFCEETQPVIDGFPSQRTNNTESVSVSWRIYD